MSTIIVVIGILLMVAGGWLVLSTILRRRSTDEEVLKASIRILPSGQASVAWSPLENLNDWRLMKLATLYVAKIGYVLDSGHPVVRDMFRTSLEYLIEDESESEREFQVRVEELADRFQVAQEEPAASGSGETFAITMVERFSEDSITNTLPFRGIAANVPISAILLMNDAASKISEPINLLVFERCVAILVREMYQIEKFDLTSLRRLFMSIKLSYEGIANEIENE